MMYPFLVGLAGGALFWLRGSAYFEQLTGRGKTTADAVWAVGLALLTGFFVAWWFPPVLALALWLGGRAPWWGSLSLGRDPRFGSRDAQWARHSLRGLLWVGPTVLALAAVGQVPEALILFLVGGLCPVFYEAGYQIDSRWELLEPTEFGEIFFGFAIAMALILAVS